LLNLVLKQDRVEKHVFELQIAPKSMLEVRTIGAHDDYVVFRCARELLEACRYDVVEDFYLTDLRKAIKQHESKQEYGRIPALLRKLAKLEPLLQQQAKLEADARRLVGNFTAGFQRVTTELAKVKGEINQMKRKDHDDNDLDDIKPSRAVVQPQVQVRAAETNVGAEEKKQDVTHHVIPASPSLTTPHVTAIDERQVLMELFHATDGSDWTRKGNWGTDKLLGTWHGVKVDEGGRITHLQLQENKLSGTYPHTLQH
jgi:hypothetical protein